MKISLSDLIVKLNVLAIFVLMVQVAKAENPWTLSKQENGITIYVRDMQGSNLKVFKGMMTIPTRLTTLVATLDDTKIYPQLFHNCKSAKLLKRNGTHEAFNYFITSMPWPVENRDSVVHSVLKQDKDTKKITIRVGSKSEMVATQSNMIRINKMSGYWTFEPAKNGNVKVTYELGVDPGGELPTWLVNALVVDIPFNTLSNLRELVKMPVYKTAKRSYIVD